MKRSFHISLILLTVALAASVASAEEMEVTLSDGTVIVGEVTQVDDNTYQVVTAGGTMTVSADQVARIEARQTLAEQYQARKAELEPGDVQGLYQLAVWARDNGLLTQARDDLETVLELDPDNENASLMLRLVNQRIAREQEDDEDDQPGPATRPGPQRTPLMSEEDIYRIRLAELRPSDRVSVDLRNEVVDRFVDQMRGIGDFAQDGFEARFRRADRVDQVVYMLRHAPNDPQMREDIRVLTDPEFMVTFRTRIWPLIEQNCASGTCHGGTEGAGDLKLLSLRIGDRAVDYSNFYILDSYQGSQGRMIWRDQPRLSLLLQFGLPRDLARLQHPTEIRPIFRNTRDPQYRLVEDWIRQLSYPPRPNYGVQYQPPGREEPQPTTDQQPEPEPQTPDGQN